MSYYMHVLRKCRTRRSQHRRSLYQSYIIRRRYIISYIIGWHSYIIRRRYIIFNIIGWKSYIIGYEKVISLDGKVISFARRYINIYIIGWQSYIIGWKKIYHWLTTLSFKDVISKVISLVDKVISFRDVISKFISFICWRRPQHVALHACFG